MHRATVIILCELMDVAVLLLPCRMAAEVAVTGYSLSAGQKPDLQKFLLVFGFQWLFQQILMNPDWAATQLKPGNVILVTQPCRVGEAGRDQDLSSPWKMLTAGGIKEQTQRAQRTFFPSSFLDKTTQSCSWLCWNHCQPWAEMQWAAPTYRWSCAF